MPISTIEGLSLIEGVLTVAEQLHLVEWVQTQLELGRQGLLPGSTFTPVPKEYAVRNQSRELLQYGTYTHSNKVQDAEIGQLTSELEFVVDRLVERGAITEQQRFDSCTINHYNTGQWIPPHIDNPHFQRPFCTVSLLSDQVACFCFYSSADGDLASGYGDGSRHGVASRPVSHTCQ